VTAAASLFLADEEATLRLGQMMAQTLPQGWGLAVALLRGPLGSGKTTLTRGFVAALPGGGQAQVASPSFNLVNIYPCRPQVAHLDLYRLGTGGFDAGLEEFLEPPLDQTRRVVLVEWAQYLPEDLLPWDYLTMDWRESGAGREITLTAKGREASAWLESIQRNMSKSGLS
jgi:tRNA threonylcarbamoyladenosine biosynthesis protein TsaE